MHDDTFTSFQYILKTVCVVWDQLTQTIVNSRHKIQVHYKDLIFDKKITSKSVT